MKELRLDVELANSKPGHLSGTGISSNATNTIKDSILDCESKANSSDESTGISNRKQREVQISHIGNIAENFFRQLDQELEVTQTPKDDSGRELKDDSDLRVKNNAGFLTDPNDSSKQTRDQKTFDADFIFRFEDQRVSTPTSVVNNKDDSVEADDSKKRTKSSCSDPIFRNKAIKTAFLLYNVTILGWGYGQMGPVFPDLQDIAGVSLKQGSWLFTGFAIGYLVGCLLGGFTQKRFCPYLLLFFYTVISAGALATLPWIPIFEVMVFLRVMHGIGLGGEDSCLHTMIFEIWGNKAGPLMPTMHVLYAVGGIISPIVTKPFLRKGLTVPMDINFTQTSFRQNSSPSLVSTNSTSENAYISDVIMTETEVHFALLISCLLLVSAAVPFLPISFKDQRAKKSQHQQNAGKVSAGDNQTLLPKHVERIVVCIFLLNAFVATAVIDLFPSFLTTFLIEQADMTRQTGSDLTSAFFAMYAVGNFLNIFGSMYIKTTKVIIFSYVSTVAILTGVLLSSLFPNEKLLSAFVSLCGVSSSAIIPTIYTWIQEHVTPMTATLASGLLVSGSLGISSNPLLTGYLMDEYSPLWFIYLSLGNVVFCAVLFIAAMLLTKIYTIEMSETEENQTHADENKNNQIEIYLNGKIQNVYENTRL